MATFAYVVKDKAGQTHSGSLDAESKSALIEQLWKKEFVVISIEERQQKRTALTRASGKVPTQQLVIFSRQLATLITSGISVISALDILAEQMDDRNFRPVLKRLKEEIEAGASLSEGIAKYPKVFSEFFINMVRAGESSGRLDEILDRLASSMEKIDTLVRKVKSSLFYPIMVTILAMGITTFLVIFVVPKFKEIFSSMGGQLPLPTQMLLNLSDSMRHYALLEAGALAGLVVAFRMYIQTSAGRLWFDRVKLRLPIVGKLFQKVAIARFARTLATLVRSGVPILTALEIVAKTAGNRVIEVTVLQARSSIKEGQNIADPLARSQVFPPMVTRMIAVGEKTGELEKMLSKIADFYESEVDTAVSGLTSLIEPLVIAFLGVVVGGIVIALFLPIFQISRLVSGV